MSKIFLLSFILFSCAPTPQMLWYNSAKTEQDFNQDKYSCQQEASIYADSKKGRAHLELTNQEIMLGGLVGDQTVLEQKRFRECMQNRGYELRKKDSD